MPSAKRCIKQEAKVTAEDLAIGKGMLIKPFIGLQSSAGNGLLFDPILILQLGGFHLLMSVCGSVFHMMEASRIEDALEQTYGQNTVSHLVSGKSHTWTLSN